MGRFVGAPEKWTPERIEHLLGIKKRRFAIQLNGNTGKPVEPGGDELVMAEYAARQAIESSGYEVGEIDLLILVSCTAQRGERLHFGRSAHDLHKILGLRSDARAEERDAGCGGALFAIESAMESIMSGRRKVVLVVASSMPSVYMNRDQYVAKDAWLSPLIFGDGAGAVVLGQSLNGRGIIDSVTGVDPAQPLMEMRGDPETDTQLAYWIDAQTVKRAFGEYAKKALDELIARVPEAADADAYLFHQVNARVLREFTEKVGIPHEKVPVNVDRRGNTAAAATLDLLDKEVRSGRVGPGSLIVLCVVGAGAQYGAMAIRL